MINLNRTFVFHWPLKCWRVTNYSLHSAANERQILTFKALDYIPIVLLHIQLHLIGQQRSGAKSSRVRNSSLRFSFSWTRSSIFQVVSRCLSLSDLVFSGPIYNILNPETRPRCWRLQPIVAILCPISSSVSSAMHWNRSSRSEIIYILTQNNILESISLGQCGEGVHTTYPTSEHQ